MTHPVLQSFWHPLPPGSKCQLLYTHNRKHQCAHASSQPAVPMQCLPMHVWQRLLLRCAMARMCPCIKRKVTNQACPANAFLGTTVGACQLFIDSLPSDTVKVFSVRRGVCSPTLLQLRAEQMAPDCLSRLQQRMASSYASACMLNRYSKNRVEPTLRPKHAAKHRVQAEYTDA